MLLYLHGFASCGDSNKTRLLKRLFGEKSVLAPDLPVAPDAAVAYIDSLIKSGDVSALAGSSLGGFYATWFSEKCRLPAVLLNPSVAPWITLKPYVGINTFWCSGEPFEWRREYPDQLKAYRCERLSETRKLVLLQTGDEVLDYRVAEAFYAQCSVVTEKGGSHRFENLDDYLETVEDFIRS